MAPRSSKSKSATPAQTFEALVKALASGDPARVDRMLDSPACAQLTPEDLGRLAFHIPGTTAARQVTLLRRLLARGADPNVRDEDGDPLVAVVAHRMSVTALRLLLARGADPDADQGRALGLVVAQPDRYAIAKLKVLVEAGADVDARPWPADHDNALMFAIAIGKIDLATCDALIELGIDLNAKDRHGATALDMAEKAGLDAIYARIRSRGGRHGRSRAERARPTHIESVLYAHTVARSRSAHACGLPIGSVYRTSKALGGRFPGCAFPPRHLVSLQLGELPFPPPVQQVGLLHVVHPGCRDCESGEYADYSIATSGTLSPLDETARPARCRSPVEPDFERPIGVRFADSPATSRALAIEVGGTPRWHQQATWPSCETCGLQMFFIVQIGGAERLYVFLCEACRVTSTIRQIN